MTNLGTSTVPREEYKWIPFASEVPVPIIVPGEEYERIPLASCAGAAEESPGQLVLPGLPAGCQAQGPDMLVPPP